MDEDTSSIAEKTREFVLKNLLFVILVCIGLILCFLGIFQYLNSQKNESTMQFIKSSENDPIEASISVDIEGEVVNPGVYTLADGSRLNDVISAAGGFSEKADKDYISQRLNLAQKITDGLKVYVPKKGELDTDKPVVLGSSIVNKDIEEDLPADNSSLVNINNASLDTLDTLPKVGPVTAQKIVDGRSYGSIEELVSKKILTQKVFDGLKDKITVQ